MDLFVILACGQDFIVLPRYNGVNRRFLSEQAFLDEHILPAVAKCSTVDHIAYRFSGGLVVLGYNHPFPAASPSALMTIG